MKLKNFKVFTTYDHFYWPNEGRLCPKRFEAEIAESTTLDIITDEIINFVKNFKIEEELYKTKIEKKSIEYFGTIFSPNSETYDKAIDQENRVSAFTLYQNRYLCTGDSYFEEAIFEIKIEENKVHCAVLNHGKGSNNCEKHKDWVDSYMHNNFKISKLENGILHYIEEHRALCGYPDQNGRIPLVQEEHEINLITGEDMIKKRDRKRYWELMRKDGKKLLKNSLEKKDYEKLIMIAFKHGLGKEANDFARILYDKHKHDEYFPYDTNCGALGKMSKIIRQIDKNAAKFILSKYLKYGDYNITDAKRLLEESNLFNGITLNDLIKEFNNQTQNRYEVVDRDGCFDWYTLKDITTNSNIDKPTYQKFEKFVISQV